MQEEDEKEIVRKCLSGEESGFRQLYHLFHIRVYHLCLGFFPHETDAQDATQEIFVKVFAHLSGFKGESALLTWIYSVALNHCRMEKRRQGAARRFAFMQNLFSAEKNNEPGLTLWEHPGIAYEKKERASRLLHAVHDLPPAQRDAILLLKYEELSYKEASAILNISVSALESLVSRAMANLRKRLRS